MQSPTDHTIYAQVVPSGSPKIVAGALKHSGVSKSSNFPTPKSSPMKRNPSLTGQESSSNRLVEEKWIDGPRVSKYKVAEARHLMREMNHRKNYETWIDGPNIKTNPQVISTTVQGTNSPNGYGYMDSHKKKMIRQWVENQTCQILHQIETVSSNPVQYHTYYKSQQNQQQQIKSDITVPRNDDDRSSICSKNEEFINSLSLGLNLQMTSVNYCETSIKTGLKQQPHFLAGAENEQDLHSEKSASNISENRQFATTGCGDMEEEDQDSGPSEVPPALPLIEPLGSREVSRHVSRESLCQNVMMMDCALQVTEDDIARAMGG